MIRARCSNQMDGVVKTASWVMRRKETGEILFETFNPRIPPAINADKYEAVPIGEYLAKLNSQRA